MNSADIDVALEIAALEDSDIEQERSNPSGHPTSIEAGSPGFDGKHPKPADKQKQAPRAAKKLKVHHWNSFHQMMPRMLMKTDLTYANRFLEACHAVSTGLRCYSILAVF